MAGIIVYVFFKMSKRKCGYEQYPQSKLRSPFNNIQMYVLPEGIGPKRCEVLKRSAQTKGFHVSSNFNCDVTHILSDLPTKEGVIKKLKIEPMKWHGKIVNTLWFAECVKANSVVSEGPYLLPTNLPEVSVSIPSESTFDLAQFNSCVPERKADLNHPNKKLAEALDLLGEYWEICSQSLVDENRALAFRRAAAAVKCLPFRVENAVQLKGVKDIGDGHAFRVIVDLLEQDRCEEVEEKKNDSQFRCLQVFCQIFGVGPSIARRWYDTHGLRSIEDLKTNFTKLNINNDMILYGTAFYEDLTTPVQFDEGLQMKKYIDEIANQLLPGVSSQMIGGFRRGKPSGHDVDILFSYKEGEGQEKGLVAAIRDELVRRHWVLWSRAEKSFDKKANSSEQSGIVDRLELCMTIIKWPFPSTDLQGRDLPPHSSTELFQWAKQSRNWRAVRLDLVSAPASQWAYALLGWTGNKQYNRSLRQWAKDRYGFLLSNAGIWDCKHHRSLAAKTEEDIFNYLNLSYRDPEQRNF